MTALVGMGVQYRPGATDNLAPDRTAVVAAVITGRNLDDNGNLLSVNLKVFGDGVPADDREAVQWLDTGDTWTPYSAFPVAAPVPKP